MPNNALKAYVRFDGRGRVVAGSLILSPTKPKNGDWREVQRYSCCTTSTTTTSSGGDFLLTEEEDSLLLEDGGGIELEN